MNFECPTPNFLIHYSMLDIQCSILINFKAGN